MVVTCEHCGARYRLDKTRIQGRGARITCPQCRHVFVVYQESAQSPVQTTAVAVERPTDVHSLDFKSVGVSGWKVKTSIGLVYDFSDFKTLRKYLKEGRVSASDSLSHDGEAWATIGDISDLEAHFIDVFVGAQAGVKATAKAEVAAEAAQMEAVDADAIAGDLLDRIAKNQPPPSSASDIGDQLLAAVEAASDDDDGGIELDMDALLAQGGGGETNVQPRARRGVEQAAVSAVAKTGSDDENPHQFVDPFESLKQSRQVRSSGRARRKSKRQVAAEVEAGTKQRKQLIIAGLLVCAAAAYFGVDQATDDGPSAAQVVAAEAQTAQAQTDANLKRHAAEARARMQENLNKALKDVKLEEITAFETAEDQLIVRVPEAFKKGGRGGVGAGGMGMPQGASQAQAQRVAAAVTQRALSAEDHFAMGQAAIRTQRWTEATGAFRSALAVQPNNANFRSWLGFVLFKSGDLNAAEAELRGAAAAGAVSAEKYLGHMARAQGDIAGANRHYQVYLRSGPADSRAIEIMIQQMAQ